MVPIIVLNLASTSIRLITQRTALGGNKTARKKESVVLQYGDIAGTAEDYTMHSTVHVVTADHGKTR